MSIVLVESLTGDTVYLRHRVFRHPGQSARLDPAIELAEDHGGMLLSLGDDPCGDGEEVVVQVLRFLA